MTQPAPVRTIVKAGLVLAVLAFSAGCTAVVVEEAPRPLPRPHPHPKPHPQVCPQIYAPVCAASHNRFRVFPNACTARASGWKPVNGAFCGPTSEPVPVVRPRPLRKY